MNELQKAFDILLNDDSPKKNHHGIESHSTLVDAKKPWNATINLGVGVYSEFTEKDGERLLAEAENLGLIKKHEFPEFPYIQKEKPRNISWSVVHENLTSLDISMIKGTSLVTQHREDAECYYSEDKSALVFRSTKGDVVMSITGDLKSHLANGYNAYVDITGLTVSWMTVQKYLTMREWRSALSTYHNQVNEWVEIKKMVVNAREFHRAWQQDLSLAKLPFKWSVGAKPILPTKPSKDQRFVKKEAVLIHLLFDHDYYDKGTLLNKRNTFLCSPKMVNSMQGLNGSKYEHELRINNVLIKKIAYKITCPDCLERVNNILKI